MAKRTALDGDAGFRQWCAKHRLSPRVDTADGTLVVPGKLGHLFYDCVDNDLLICVLFQPPRPMKGWKNRREALLEAGANIVHSGDTEGIACFKPDNTKVLRVACRAVGIRQRRKLTPEEREETLRRLELAREERAKKLWTNANGR